MKSKPFTDCFLSVAINRLYTVDMTESGIKRVDL